MVRKRIDEIENKNLGRTPSLLGVQKAIFDAMMADVRVGVPAKVLRYDHKKQQADVQPYFKKKYRDGAIYDAPQIFNVPVWHPSTRTTFVHVPLKKGDNVTLIFMDRSMDKWLANGGKVDPEDTRMHHMSDAVAFPGLYPFGEAHDIANPDDIIIKNGPVEMRIKPNNHFEVINSKEEFVKVLNDMLLIIREAVVYTSDGPQKLRHHLLAVVQKRLQTFLQP